MWQLIGQATQPAGGFANWTSAEVIAVIGAFATAVTSIIVAVRAGTKATEANTKADANSVRLNQHSDRLYNMALDSTPPPITGTGPGGKPGDTGGGTGSRVPRPTPMPTMPTGTATFTTSNAGVAQMTNWIPTEPK